MNNKKIVASFELSLMIVSVFAFAFMVGATAPEIEKSTGGISPVKAFFVGILGKLKKPMIPSVSAQAATSQPSECCEKTKEGGFCINTAGSNCDDNFKSAPSSCETTSYCRLGTCYDSGEGICMANTPQRVCDDNGGTWDLRPVDEVPQCQLGCCIIADQAAFVPLVRCKRLSTLFGVENDYRTDITNEVQCLATAQSQDMGACVFDKDFERICEFTTQGECGAGQQITVIDNETGQEVISESGGKQFYKNYLCSAEELNTACARQTTTQCYEGKVYWYDSCGNRENVYSSNKAQSWNNGMVAEPDSVCNPNDGSDKNCGNCEYLLGSRCAEWEGVIGGPSDGDFYCQTNECVDRDGDKRINGESWCVHDGPEGEGKEQVGARYYREVCVDGEVRVEPCADRRAEICVEDSISTSDGAFATSGCRVNRWQDCYMQLEEDDCTNIDARDCMWVDPVLGMLIGGNVQEGDGSTAFSNPTADGPAFTNPTAEGDPTGGVIAPITGRFIGGLFGGDDDEEGEDSGETETNRPDGVCVPNYAPGLEFWGDPESQAICGQANAKCVVEMELSLIEDWSDKFDDFEDALEEGDYEKAASMCEGDFDGEDCECLTEAWAQQANAVCTTLGDCGAAVNYNGDYTDDGYNWLADDNKLEFGGQAPEIGGGITGLVSVMTGLVASGFGLVEPNNIRYGGAQGTVAGYPDWSYEAATKRTTNLQTPPANAPVTGSLETATGTLARSSTLITKAPLTQAGVVIPEGTTWTLAADGSASTVIGGTQHTLTAAEVTAAQGAGQIGLPSGGSSWLSNTLGGEGIITGGAADALLSGVQWAAVAYFAGQLIGPMLGFNEDQTQAFSTALAAGFGVGRALSVYQGSGLGWFGAHPVLAGAAVGIIVFVLMYKEVETVVVSFDCMPWQAPTGVSDAACEVCNDDDLPCSEYRCRSLGQSCQIANPGTDQERCVNVNPRDVDPPIITPDEEKLTPGHGYTNVKNSPPGPGFTIVNLESNDGCIKAFTPLEFGIKTDEPAQCKIDFNHTTTMDDMINYFGGSNFYSYEHEQTFSLPGAAALENGSFVLENGKEWNFFIRCRDSNGNENEAEYAVQFCIDPSPDTTAAEIKSTSINNGGCVAEDQSEASVDFYTNEPADCRWSTTDQSYENMQNNMACTGQAYQLNAQQLFTCRATLTGIARDNTDFYVRCKDQPGAEENDRNTNAQSFKFSLRGSTALTMSNSRPNGTIFGAVRPAPVELYTETRFGCDDGVAICSYATVDNDGAYIAFFDTGAEDGIHTQRLDLDAGNHQYFIKCVDGGGNVVKDTLDFRVEIDENAPVVARVYEEDNLLKIVTVRDSECVYTFDGCDYSFQEGTVMPYANSSVHVTEWNEDETFYIKCRDEFRNEDADCSIIVRPSRDFL